MLPANIKPPYSFPCLIFMAIEESPQKALPVKEIYSWILDHFPYFQNTTTGWKNSVRYNLSLNKCFQKVEKVPKLGRGSLWIVDPQYKPNLIQALSRYPFLPSLDRKTKPSVEMNTSVETEYSDDSLDAVDAATVMLSLKTVRQEKNNEWQVMTILPSQDHTYAVSYSVKEESFLDEDANFS